MPKELRIDRLKRILDIMKAVCVWPDDRQPANDDERIAYDAWLKAKSQMPCNITKITRRYVIDQVYDHPNCDPNHLINAELYFKHSRKFYQTFNVPLSRFWKNHATGFDVVLFDTVVIKTPISDTMQHVLETTYGNDIRAMIWDFVENYGDRIHEVLRHRGYKPIIHKNIRKPRRELKRKVEIEGKNWTYQVGSSGVKIYNPDMSITFTVALNELLGETWETIERAGWKRTNRANVAPRDVKNYIVKHFLGSLVD